MCREDIGRERSALPARCERLRHGSHGFREGRCELREFVHCHLRRESSSWGACSLASAGRHLVVARGRWASLACLLVCRRTGLVVFKILPRGSTGFGRSARDGSPAPEERETKRAKLFRLFHWGSATSVRRARLPNRGVREKPYAGAGCHAAP